MSSSFFNESLQIRDASQQKRKQARANAKIEASFFLQGQNEAHSCYITDLGTGGMSILSKSSLYMGDRVRVQFKMNGTMNEMDTEVVRVSGKSVGLRFLSLSEKQLQNIQEFIHSAFFSTDKQKNK